MSKAVAVVSGGMDSVTALYWTHSYITNDVRVLSFDYGQKHSKELSFARWHADTLGLQHDVVDLTSITKMLTSSALVDTTQAVPEGHYADETMKATVVPNRNMMMLSIATAVAVNDKAEFVVAGMHAGDHPIYPDCRPAFVDAMSHTVHVANEGFIVPAFKLFTPFITSPKASIVTVGTRLNIPFERTWSCYKGGEFHCGMCGTCVERKEAFELAGIDDPTVYSYEDTK